MIEGLGQAKPIRLESPHAGGVARSAATVATRVVSSDPAGAPAPAAALAAACAAIDTAKVDRIRAGIADGSYRVDADAIAGKMIEQDLA